MNTFAKPPTETLSCYVWTFESPDLQLDFEMAIKFPNKTPHIYKSRTNVKPTCMKHKRAWKRIGKLRCLENS